MGEVFADVLPYSHMVPNYLHIPRKCGEHKWPEVKPFRRFTHVFVCGQCVNFKAASLFYFSNVSPQQNAILFDSLALFLWDIPETAPFAGQPQTCLRFHRQTVAFLHECRRERRMAQCNVSLL